MEENGMANDEIRNIDLTRILGGTTVHINRKFAVKLGPRLDQVLKSEEFAGESPSELLRQIIAIAAEKIGGVSGSTVSTNKLAGEINKMGGGEEPIAQEVR